MRQQKRRVLGLAVAGLGAALTIAGCGAGQITQTDAHEPAVNGAQAQVGGGKLLVRDAALNFPEGENKVYPAGSDAPLSLRVINNGSADDELVQASAEGASSVEIQGDKKVVAGSVLVVGEPTEFRHAGEHAPKPSSAKPTGAAESSSAGAPEASGAQPSGAPGSSESPESSAAAGEPAAGGQATAPQEAPASEDPRVGEAKIVLKGLTKDVRPGQTVKVTLVFRDAGPVVVDMPISSSGIPREDKHGEAEHGGAGAEHGKPAEGH